MNGSTLSPDELTFKSIVQDKDNWSRYQSLYADRVTAHQIAEVEKMLGCGNPENGYATYICLHCGETKRVCFSCKSRVCASCGKVQADEWSNQLISRLFNVAHRHITFTIPAELWPLLESHSDWRKELFGAANETLRQVMKAEPGIVMVLHPYGKDLKVNYHLHVLVTEGGLTESDEWKKQRFLNYKALRKTWQYKILTRLRGVMPPNRETAQLIDRLFQQYRKGFYVYAEPRVSSGSGIERYIGRYIRHPAIADSRIIGYDGEQVTFYYEDHNDERHEVTLPVLEFIHGVVRHIPPKQFKMVRYYGLYAPRKASSVRALMQKIGQMLGRVVRKLDWRGRIQRDFGRDPLECPRCGGSAMELYSLTVPWRGEMKTIGGMKWLFERGSLMDEPDGLDADIEQPVTSPVMQMRQLALGI
jgi:hypothetical protein